MVRGQARVSGEAMSAIRKAKIGWRYVLSPVALMHRVRNWRRIGVRNRYYAVRTDPAMIEISLEAAEFLLAHLRYEQLAAHIS